MGKNVYQETAETWNKVASLYQSRFMHLDIYNHTYDYLCQHLNTPQARVLELGCGPGNISRYLLAKCPGIQLLGVDIAPAMVQLSKENNPSASFEVMDVREVAKLAGPFDAIVAGFCLPYLSLNDTEKLLKDAYTLLNQQGLLYLSFVDGDPLGSGYQTGSSGHRMYFFYHRLNVLQDLLRACDFTAEQQFTINYTKADGSAELHNVLIARKNN